jgi:hypothetical protein
MADEPASSDDGKLRLTVTEARREDVGRGIVRLDPEDMRRIKASPGDIIEIEGRLKTVAKALFSWMAWRAPMPASRSASAPLLTRLPIRLRARSPWRR